ncbi:MAG TPA: SDR family oxidoreductase [Thermoanaerobaculia bacterium]|nr:SDR family oxidoreductase [Thermoanaerobaculia bacterium]HQR66753.1 SDR family oxidoreductase [Thermoanaerobaculia bacterium]
MTVRHALVIAPHGGVGSAVARELRRRGARVSGAGRTTPDDGLVDAFHPVELAGADWAALFDRVAAGGPLDAVVYAAGTAAFGRTASIPLDEARATFDVNFWPLAASARAAAARWERDGVPGCFLAVLSIAGLRAVPFEAFYGASKAAAVRFLDALQLEVSPSIRLIPACPGLIRTAFREHARWHGVTAPESAYGATPEEAAAALCDLLEGSRRARVLGWRERSIDLADRIFPGLYDRLVLRRRVQKDLRA